MPSLLGATAKRIVGTVPMNLQHVPQDSVVPGCSNAITETAHQPRRSATESTIVAIIPTRNSATHHVQSWSSSAVLTAAAFKTVGSATATLIVKTVRTKPKIYVTTVLATTIQNSRAKTADASPNCGCAISTTIVETIPMNPRICVDSGIVPLVGRGAPEDPTTVAFQNGSSVTEKTIVGTAPTNSHKIALNATQKPNSNAPTIDVFLNSGCATFPTIAVTAPTRQNLFVRDTIDPSVPNRNSVAPTENVFRRGGGAIKTMTVMTTATNSVVQVINAKTGPSNALQVTASPVTYVATGIGIVATCPMN